MRSPLAPCLAIVCLAACGSSPDEEAVEASLGTLVQALQAKDPARVWALSDEVSKHAVLDVVKTLEGAQAKIPLVWGTSCAAGDASCKSAAAKEARDALGGPLLDAAGPDDAGRGPRVLGYLVDLDKLAFGSHVMDGLGPKDMTFEPGPPRRVIVHTAGGDIFGFVDEGGTWRSLLVRDLVLDHPLIRELLANAKKTEGLAAEHHRAWQLGLDPTTPQGAYNVARKLQSSDPPDWKALFALLDPLAQTALGTAMEKARAVQKKIQARTAKGQRKDAYDDSGIALMVEATSDRDLYLRWSKTPGFVKPLAATDEPTSLEGDLASGKVAVVTTSGKRVPMVRDTEGYWRIADAQGPIEQALVAPAQKALETP
ncbi:MAG: hypothetical protein U1F43_37220 [Myxococcota bacterium]